LASESHQKGWSQEMLEACFQFLGLGSSISMSASFQQFPIIWHKVVQRYRHTRLRFCLCCWKEPTLDVPKMLSSNCNLKIISSHIMIFLVSPCSKNVVNTSSLRGSASVQFLGSVWNDFFAALHMFLMSLYFVWTIKMQCSNKQHTVLWHQLLHIILVCGMKGWHSAIQVWQSVLHFSFLYWDSLSYCVHAMAIAFCSSGTVSWLSWLCQYCKKTVPVLGWLCQYLAYWPVKTCRARHHETMLMPVWVDPPNNGEHSGKYACTVLTDILPACTKLRTQGLILGWDQS
jgi:hypothetical protein